MASEIATDTGRGLMILSQNGLPLINQFYLFPYDTFKNRSLVLDILAVFLYDYLLSGLIPLKDLPPIVSNLKRIAGLINSQPLSGGGAFESLIEERGRALTRSSQPTLRESEPIPESFTSLDQIAVAITHEFMVITNVDLTLTQVGQQDTDNYTQIEIKMQFLSDEIPDHGDLETPHLLDLIEALTAFVAAGQGRQRNSVHSIKYSCGLFTDAIMFLVKVNWKSYEGEDRLSFFEV